MLDNVDGLLPEPPSEAEYGPSVAADRACRSCVHYGMRVCDLWNARVRGSHVCNQWEEYVFPEVALSEDGMEDESMPDGEDELTDRQETLYEALEQITEMFGSFDQGVGPDGAHYIAESPFDIKCADCAFFEEGKCEIVEGDIAPEGVCRFWIIPPKPVSE